MARVDKEERGLTLVEVLVALAILSLVVASILALIGQSTRFLSVAEEKSLAAIAADNLLIETLATAASLERGATQGEIAVGARSFAFQREVSEAGLVGVVRIDVTVRAGDEGRLLARASTLKEEKP